jgi:hypothetical protein
MRRKLLIVLQGFGLHVAVQSIDVGDDAVGLAGSSASASTLSPNT